MSVLSGCYFLHPGDLFHKTLPPYGKKKRIAVRYPKSEKKSVKTEETDGGNQLMDRKTYFERQRNRYGAGELKWCADRAREQWPGEAAHILRVADEVTRLEFIFDLPWDMEQTSQIQRFSYPVDWTYMPGDDPEFIYQMNRHRYLICLGQAYAMTGDEKYAETFVKILEDWIRNVPLTEESRSTTWRELEAGLRGEYWTKAVLYFEESPALTDPFMEMFTESLRIHGEYLMQSDRAFLISSNWGVISYSGLFLIGAALGEKRYMETALERLVENARVQILPDGVHWEQSCMYHNEVLHCFMEVLNSLQHMERGVYAEKDEVSVLEEAVGSMAEADLAWIKPDGCQPLMGDSDETNIRDVLTFAAVLLARSGSHRSGKQEAELLKGCGYDCLDYENIWNLKEEGWRGYENIRGRLPEQTDYFLEESGNYILRSSWDEKARYLRFRCGCLGGGHGHNDRLHIDLADQGEDILVDAGRYEYTCHEEGRIWLKSAFAHNTILTDGRDYMEYTDSWGYRNTVPEMRFPAVRRGGITLLQGGHGGYFQNGAHVLLERKVLALPGGIFVLADTAFTDEIHTYSRLFHFNRKGRVWIEGRDRIWYQGDKASAMIQFPDRETELSYIRSRMSRHYNSIEDNPAVKADTRAEGKKTMLAVIICGAGCETETRMIPVENPVTGMTLDERDAQALEIRSGGHIYTVIFRSQDLTGPWDLLRAGDCTGMGRVLVSEDGKVPVVFG